MHLSIRWRLAAGIVFAFAVTLVVIFFTVQFALQRILTDNLDNSLNEAGKIMQARIILAGSLDDDRLYDDVQFYATVTEANDPFITVIRNADGEMKWITKGVQPASLAITNEQRERVLAGDILRDTLYLPGDKQYRVRTSKANLADNEAAIVQVARLTEGVVDPVNTLLLILAAEGIVATILAVGAALWLSRGAVRPLQRVIDVAAEIQASDLRRRIHAQRELAAHQAGDALPRIEDQYHVGRLDTDLPTHASTRQTDEGRRAPNSIVIAHHRNALPMPHASH